MTKHTPELWPEVEAVEVENGFVYARIPGIAGFYDKSRPVNRARAMAHAERARACVNKLAGHADLDAVEIVDRSNE